MTSLYTGQKTTHPIVESSVESDTEDTTVDTTVSKRSVNPNCVLKTFDPDVTCDKSVYDVLVPTSTISGRKEKEHERKSLPVLSFPRYFRSRNIFICYPK